MEYSLRKFAVLSALAPIVILGGAIIALFGLWQGFDTFTPVGAVVAITGVLMLISSVFSFRRTRRAFVAEEARLLACPRITAKVTKIRVNPDITIGGQHPWLVEARGKADDGAVRVFQQSFSFHKPDVREGQKLEVGIDPDDPEKYLIIVPNTLQEENRTAHRTGEK